MTSRERILTALRHEEPDRVPLDLGGTESSGLTAIAYNRLRRHLGLPPGRTQVFDVYQQVVKIEDDLRDRLGIDTVPLHIEPLDWKPFVLVDGSASEIPAGWNPERDGDDWVIRCDDGTVTARMPAGGFYFEPAGPPLAGVTGIAQLDHHADAIESYDWPAFFDEPLSRIAERARELHDETDRAVVFNLQCHVLAGGLFLRGFEAFMIDLVADPGFATALLERLTDAYVRRVERVFAELRGRIDVVLLNDDLGTQNGPMLSLDCYRRLIRPHQERLFGAVREHAGVPILFHSCGSVRRFIPDLIEAGVAALNPVQVSAAEMDSADLKREFGDRLTFWGGGCDTQSVLAGGSAGEVRDEVRRRVRDFAPGGGFVFTQVHNIQPDVPPENIVAMLDALRECHSNGEARR
jgi:uroporphyrinogen decarboxylase